MPGCSNFMATSQSAKNERPNSLTLILIVILLVAAVFGAVLSFVYSGFSSLLSGGTYVSGGGAIYNAIYVVLTLVTDALYLFGGGVMAFGAYW